MDSLLHKSALLFISIIIVRRSKTYYATRAIFFVKEPNESAKVK